jgi:Flp pilus assembly pilin Flp
MKNNLRKINILAFQALTAVRNIPESQRGALTIEWGQIIGIIVLVLLAVGALLQAFIPGFFQSILDKLGG